ncbi:hypothetical protein NITMOv2_4055 [Nitrospira moscoviensis]|uniref:Transposase n=1 Tax=Nitrospira moscoviensis TaxID=42253 RepID=A0A0K2GHW6_NITMO|nr:hypothetical protein NITMOv2_4055 [Nitrospira moscoviensis]
MRDLSAALIMRRYEQFNHHGLKTLSGRTQLRYCVKERPGQPKVGLVELAGIEPATS